MNDFYSPSRVAHERGKEVRKPWVALLRFLMMVQHSCSSTGRELQREPSRTPPALCWSQESIRKEKEHLMLSWSLLTGTVAVIQWPELLDQCGNLGYLTSYIQLRWLFFFSCAFRWGLSYTLWVQIWETTRNFTGKPRALHLKRNSTDCPKQPLKNTIGTGKTQCGSSQSWMALFNAREELKIEISKITRSDIPLQKTSHSMLPGWPRRWHGLGSLAGKEQHLLPGLMDTTAGQGARGSEGAAGGKSRFLSTDTEIGSTYPNPAPILRKKCILFFWLYNLPILPHAFMRGKSCGWMDVVLFLKLVFVSLIPLLPFQKEHFPHLI